MGLQYFEGLSLHTVVVTHRRKGETRLVNPGWCHDDGVSEGPRRPAASERESGEEGQTQNRAEYLERVKVLVIQSCLTLCDPMDCSQASLSMEFSRQEHWSG